MATIIRTRSLYSFEKSKPGHEVQALLATEQAAISRLERGKDVYTFVKNNAKNLANRVRHRGAIDEFPHSPTFFAIFILWETTPWAMCSTASEETAFIGPDA